MCDLTTRLPFSTSMCTLELGHLLTSLLRSWTKLTPPACASQEGLRENVGF